MIVWQGLGFLAVLIPMILIGLIGDMEIALLMSAFVVWFAGKKLNSKPGKVLIDPETNEEVEIKNKHTLFWIPMEWFAIVIMIIAVYNWLT